MSAQVTHPDYSGGIFPSGQGDRCVCGGVRYWHALPPHGCDDCKECTAFDPAPLGPTEAQVRAQVAAETTDLVRALQAMCDDEWLRRRDRIMRLPGTRYMRDNGAGEIEYAAHMVRHLIGDLPGYDNIATSGAYLDWMRNGRDEGAERIARGESR